MAAFMSDDSAVARFLVEQRHVHGALFRPEAEQGPAAGREIARDAAPRGFIHDRARPRPCAAALLRCGIVSMRLMRYPRTPLATFWNQTTSGGGR